MSDEIWVPPDDAPCHALLISTRVCQALHIENIRTVGQLRALTDAEIIRIPGISKIGLKQIRRSLPPSLREEVPLDAISLESVIRRIVRQEIRSAFANLARSAPT